MLVDQGMVPLGIVHEAAAGEIGHAIPKPSQIKERDSYHLAGFQEMAAVLGSLGGGPIPLGHFQSRADRPAGEVAYPQPPQRVGELRRSADLLAELTRSGVGRFDFGRRVTTASNQRHA